MSERNTPELAPDAEWGLYVGGEWTSPSDAGTLEVVDPATQEAFTEVPSVGTEVVDEAYETAAQAQTEWAKVPPQERADIVAQSISLIHDHHDELVDLIVREVGGTHLKAETELHIAEGIMNVAASFPFRDGGSHEKSIIPGKENIVERDPVGVVGVITPWNFPFNLSMRAVAPAIALGNSVVLKPAPDTPITGGLALAAIFEEAGLPPGVLNVVAGDDEEIGDHFSGHPVPEVMSFTGSTEIGKRVAKRAAEQLTEPALELGGNNVHIVTDDADVEYAADAAAFGSFVHSGQVCISINRHLVHEDVYDEYVEVMTERAESLPTGDPKEEETIVGPVINESQRDKIVSFIEETVDAGATLETGGDHDGLVVEPTILSDVTNEMAAACNEHFGPVAPVIPFSSDEEAIEIANDTRMGLSGSVHSDDLGRARRIADEIETGMIHINDQPINDEPHIPFGGVKESGMGRYNADAILRKFTRTKWTSVMHEQREYPF
ncbi:aldehyde dehydrogenase family protein [Natronorubrum sp. FCH18a]|uniref:aldehyde dehydrogenase family protein n=1 Tax=Natronorubrum sp. FCH18a TaxID=3447018 RepID=UPI003F519F40